MRNLGTEEEEELRKATQQLRMLENEIEELQKQIDDFDCQNDADSLDRIKNKSFELAAQRKEKEERVGKIQPDLDRLKTALDDQERHKKNLNRNINVISLNSRIRDIKKEIGSLQEAAANVAGHETAYDDAQRLRNRETEIAQMNARLEGRRGEIYENYFLHLQRKLSQPEYKNVGEEHRVGLIKSETTQMAVRDIDKYHSALDKALQHFHSLKIAEINTIIRDLWNLTYKGEDITSIELESGHEPGSRSSRSYNYRVVMTKGSTQLDMRGTV
jgi:DNA repair protein RAD50